MVIRGGCGVADRTVTEGSDGRVVVRVRQRKLTIAKKRSVLVLVGQGMTPASAARAVGVSSQTVAREAGLDEVFGRDLEAARAGFGLELEDIAHERATVGSVRRFFDRKTGELIREEHVPSDRLMEMLLSSNLARYKPAAAQTTVVVVPPLSSEELARLREVGRADVEVTERLAEEAAAAEWDRDQRLLTAGGKP